MDERDLELLVTLDETHNITHAADRLYVTQSALSKRINALEQELNTQIMIRSRQGIRFTAQGETVLKHAYEIMTSLQKMREKIQLQKNHISGTLRAGVSINYAHYVFPEVLARYRQEFPHVNIQVKTNYSRNVYQDLVLGKIDVAIVRGEFHWKEHKILLNRERVNLIRSSNSRDTNLKQLPYIGRHSDATFEREVAQWMRENQLHPNKHNGIIVDNVTTCVEMVSRGLGWAIVPDIALPYFKGDIHKLSFKNGEPFIRSTYLLFNKETYQLPQIKAFIKTAQIISD
ncbi:LysR family transcriptional regulator [Streptococcus pseudoporcinus]|uniref:LysR substrate binding domain protein n=1 Tax=Streptococcus pseudoporcinus LQ 940-04 TaxID=875093 RepID=G5K7Q1_9STRE|nr:LysR family transcriptional regulator [Streptococcus pseudoporcinus]EFR44913.1 LysR substrate binding domain protein [Streptococcus pseudoporcinus SPIN 20026]EHI65123.1 LysR substrate binding domain protein [Streptococcus pseudoporcinus LQ 940-04]VEF94081.1 LysR family transcriptional regulator [Streptococcus pseudoporcinus]